MAPAPKEGPKDTETKTEDVSGDRQGVGQRGAWLHRLRQSWAQAGVTNSALTPEPELLVGSLVSHKCRAAAVS